MEKASKNSKERKNNMVHAGGKDYYSYLNGLKKDKDNSEYSVSFMMF